MVVSCPCGLSATGIDQLYFTGLVLLTSREEVQYYFTGLFSQVFRYRYGCFVCGYIARNIWLYSQIYLVSWLLAI